jgi:hypothetical protein
VCTVQAASPERLVADSPFCGGYAARASSHVNPVTCTWNRSPRRSKRPGEYRHVLPEMADTAQPEPETGQPRALALRRHLVYADLMRRLTQIHTSPGAIFLVRGARNCEHAANLKSQHRRRPSMAEVHTAHDWPAASFGGLTFCQLEA